MDKLAVDRLALHDTAFVAHLQHFVSVERAEQLRLKVAEILLPELPLAHVVTVQRAILG